MPFDIPSLGELFNKWVDSPTKANQEQIALYEESQDKVDDNRHLEQMINNQFSEFLKNKEILWILQDIDTTWNLKDFYKDSVARCREFIVEKAKSIQTAWIALQKNWEMERWQEVRDLVDDITEIALTEFELQVNMAMMTNRTMLELEPETILKEVEDAFKFNINERYSHATIIGRQLAMGIYEAPYEESGNEQMIAKN